MSDRTTPVTTPEGDVGGMDERHNVKSSPTHSLLRHESPHDDWLYLGDGERLHRIFSIEWAGDDPTDPTNECYGHGYALCGLGGRFSIPGLFSRMGAERCARCCDRLGIPRGKGNTLNAGIEEPEYV